MTLGAQEFQEIGHCGGKFTVSVRTGPEGRKSLQFGIRNSRPTAASIVGVCASPDARPIGMFAFGGIGQPLDPAPSLSSFPIFLASDSLGKFGHSCPRCGGYWRSDGPSVMHPTYCPYCGLRAGGQAFLTDGQLAYVQACCEMIHKALESEKDGEFEIDMDEVADAAGKAVEKPKFYYAEQSQQKKFECKRCETFNDVLGRYGYCSGCGSQNGVEEVEADANRVKKKAAPGENESCLKDLIASFDSFAGHIAGQLVKRVPMTPARRKEWERRKFHNLKSCADDLKSVFDISLFDGIRKEDIDYAILMFHRRHVYEHNGGEVDEKYIRDSGDTSVKLKQRIHETKQSVDRTAELVLKLSRNLHSGFHKIFPVRESTDAGI